MSAIVFCVFLFRAWKDKSIVLKFFSKSVRVCWMVLSRSSRQRSRKWVTMCPAADAQNPITVNMAIMVTNSRFARACAGVWSTFGSRADNRLAYGAVLKHIKRVISIDGRLFLLAYAESIGRAWSWRTRLDLLNGGKSNWWCQKIGRLSYCRSPVSRPIEQQVGQCRVVSRGSFRAVGPGVDVYETDLYLYALLFRSFDRYRVRD